VRDSRGAYGSTGGRGGVRKRGRGGNGERRGGREREEESEKKRKEIGAAQYNFLGR